IPQAQCSQALTAAYQHWMFDGVSGSRTFRQFFSHSLHYVAYPLDHQAAKDNQRILCFCRCRHHEFGARFVLYSNGRVELLTPKELRKAVNEDAHDHCISLNESAELTPEQKDGVAQAMARLDDDDFDERQRASAYLGDLGEAALPALQQGSRD